MAVVGAPGQLTQTGVSIIVFMSCFFPLLMVGPHMVSTIL